MQSQPNAAGRQWLLRPTPRPQAQARLVCFPYAGGGATLFRLWPQSLPDTIELCAVQLPGRESRLREPAFTQIAPLIEAVAEIVTPLLDLPVVFFGHSMGALIAFELAREFRRRALPSPHCLIVSGRRAPQLLDRDPPLHALPEAAFIQGMAQRYNGIPKVILDDVDLLQLFLPTIRSDLAVVETYTYAEEQPLDCPIVACGGWGDPRASQAELDAWRIQTSQAFAVRMFAGDHFFMNSAREALLQEVTRAVRTHVVGLRW